MQRSNRLARTVLDTVLLLTALLLIAIAPQARSAPAVVSSHDAGIGYCEGCEQGTVSLTLAGNGYLTAYALVPDPKTGKHVGPGTLSYDLDGVHYSNEPVTVVASFFNPSVAYCAPIDRFIAEVEAFAGPNASRVLSTRFPVVIDPPNQCPSETITVDVGDVGGNLGRYKKWITF